MEIIDNKEKKRFEYHVDDHVAFIVYKLTKEKIYLIHTEVPSKLEGQGIGSNLVKNVLQIIKKKDLTLVPLCPFVVAYIKRHPEWEVLVR